MASLWIIAACVFFALMSAVIKYTALKIGILEILFYRSLINLILISTVIRVKGLSFKTQRFSLHFLRSLLGVLAMYCGFYALIHLPLATAMTLSYTHPIFQTLIACLTQRALIGKFQILAVVLGFLGCLILLNPKFSNPNMWATCIGLLSGLFTALAYFNVGKLVRAGESEFLIIFNFSLVGTVFSLVAVTLMTGFSAVDSETLLGIVAIGLLGTMGQFALTRAYGHGNVMTVAVLSYNQIIFAVILGYVFFSESMTWSAMMGIIFIVAAGLSAVYKKSNLQ
ncbi:DMT family transporter [Acinetobacter larvae]|uniref:EamA domain-containing protein n=1 Tax=Acinetobacter larvae TaxID=1789224 RepID=A0A1B2LYP2_9GAMM|nr:DMT family transporter [Acinetobacter larvae]AOA58060.1 hypothetical protein BFG52_06650 [Acinetobacter larvae]